MSPAPLTGTPIGTPGSYAGRGNTIARATDGNSTSFFDAPTADGCWVGLDLGSPQTVTAIRFTPRPGYTARMAGGVFQWCATPDFFEATNAWSINATPPEGPTTVTLATPVTARYWRYVGDANSYCNIAEFALLGTAAAPAAELPAVPADPATMAVSDAGVLTLSLNRRAVVTGTLGLAGQTPLATSGHQDAPGHAAVIVRYANVTLTQDLTLRGPDLRINVICANEGTAPSGPLALDGLTYSYAGPATGNIHAWNFADLALWGASAYHPGTLSPDGAVTATDGTTHVGLWSATDCTADRPCLFNADATPSKMVAGSGGVTLYTQRIVPPGGAVTVNHTVRLTTDGTTAGLYSGYRADLHAATAADLGPNGLAHVPHPGPVAAAASVNAAWARADNADGFNDGGGNNPLWRRLDLAAGAAAFPGAVGGPLAKAGGTAVFFWSPGGYETVLPSGPKADVWTCDALTNVKQIAATWPTIVAGLHAMGLKVCLCLRLCDLYDANGNPYRASSANPAHVAAVMAQVDGLVGMGCDGLYLDSVGISPDDTQMVVLLRRHLGANVLLLSEQGSDLLAAYCDRYCEVRADGLSYLDPGRLALIRYLWPGFRAVAVSRAADPLDRGGADDLMIEDYQVGLLPAAAH